MKIIKKVILSGILATSMCLGFISDVKAAETCNVSFTVVDETDNGYSGNVKVIMTNTENNKTFEYVLTKGNSWGGENIPKYTVDGDAIYSVSLSGVKDGFEMINQDGSEITQFDGNTDVDLKWKIVSVASENITVKEEADAGAGNVTISDEIQTGNTEADNLFNEFMKTVSFIKDDESWVYFLESYELYADSGAISNSDEYAKATGKSKEEYKSMSSFDKFVYYETYVRMAQYLNLGDWERYYSSKENFDRNVIGPTVDYMKITEGDSTVVADAYKKLMDWQYQYIEENKSPYDFIAGKNYIETVGADNTPDDEFSISDPIQENTEDKSMWSEVKDVVTDNAGSIFLAGSLAIAIAVITLYRKKRNLNEND